MPKKKIKESSVFRAPNHKKYYVTNIVGGLTDQDIRFELLNEKIRDDKKASWNYIADAMVIFTPLGAKRLFEDLKKYLDVWENEKGKIVIPKSDKHIISVK